MPFNILATRSGNSAYMTSFAAALRAAGCRVDLVCFWSLRGRRPFLRFPKGHLAPYSNLHFRSCLRLGDWIVSLNPLDWRHWLIRSGNRPRHGKDRLSRLGPRERKWLLRQVRRNDPDLVVANYYTGADLFAALGGPEGTAILSHDIFADRNASARALERPELAFPEAEKAEMDAFRKAGLVITIKDEDGATLRRRLPGLRTVTYPMTLPPVSAAPKTERPPICVYVGSGHAANIDGLDWLLDEIWPQVLAARPDARLRVVGKMAELRDGPWPARAEAAGFVESLASEYAATGVALAPIRLGSGVKIKTVEALAHGLPVVSTPHAAEGIAPAPRQVLRVAATAEAFADAVVEALADPDPAASSRAAGEFARHRFGFEEAGLPAIHDILAAARAPGEARTERDA